MDEQTHNPYRALARLKRAASLVPPLRDPTWRALLRSYLAAEPHVTRVLADFCTDHEIPNIRPGPLDQRVRYVLGVIPPESAHRIACDLVEHILKDNASLLHGLSIKRLWLDGAVDDAKLKDTRNHLQATMRHTVGREALLHCLSASPSPSVPQQVSCLAAEAARKDWYSTEFERETRWQMTHLSAFLA